VYVTVRQLKQPGASIKVMFSVKVKITFGYLAEKKLMPSQAITTFYNIKFDYLTSVFLFFSILNVFLS